MSRYGIHSIAGFLEEAEKAWLPKARVELVTGEIVTMALGDYKGRKRGPMTAAEKSEATTRLLALEDRLPDDWQQEPLPPQRKIVRRVLEITDYRKSRNEKAPA